MEKTFNKIRTWFATLWVAIVSFISKVFWQSLIGNGFGREDEIVYQSAYWVPWPESQRLLPSVINIAQWLLIWVTLIVWITSFIKIKRIDNKAQRKKKIIMSVITIAILILLIVASIIKFWITNPLKYNKQSWWEPGTNIIKWIFIWVILLIGILYLIRTRKIKDKRQRRKVIIKAIVILTLIVTYLILAR